MVKSRKLSQIKIMKNGLPPNTCYCRKCGQIKREALFYKSTDTYLDSNGYMSVCKDCITESFMDILASENGVIEKAMLRMCRMLNVRYDEEALRQAVKMSESRSGDKSNTFGFYRLKLVTTSRGKIGSSTVELDFTYEDNPVVNFTAPPIDEEKAEKYNDKEYENDMRLFWGNGYTPEEYEFLENELADWKKTYSCQNKGEELILKELSHKALELAKARESQKSTTDILKSLQELMKNGGLTPSQTSAANASKNADTLGKWIKDIEEKTPAEWVKDKDMFKDVDGLEDYFQTYIVSPLRSFVTGSKEFSIEGAEIEEEDDE